MAEEKTARIVDTEPKGRRPGTRRFKVEPPIPDEYGELVSLWEDDNKPDDEFGTVFAVPYGDAPEGGPYDSMEEFLEAKGYTLVEVSS